MSDVIYIIILNYNNCDQTIVTIDSCLTQDYPNIKILLVDNNSKIKCFNQLVSHYGNRIEYLRLEENYGYAEGNNRGVKFAFEKKCKYSLILNNDTILVGNKLVTKIHQIISLNNDIAAINPIIFNKTHNGYETINTTSKYVKALLRFRILNNKNSISYGSDCKEITLCHGSALFINNEIFLELGGFPREYFMYNEENEFSIKAKLKGYILLQYKSNNEFILHNHIKKKYDNWKIYLMARNFELSKKIFLKKRFIVYCLHFLSNINTLIRHSVKFHFTYVKYFHLGLKNGRKLINEDEDTIFCDALDYMMRLNNGK